jgi:O-antigen/teichoic acid export membrane protein
MADDLNRQVARGIAWMTGARAAVRVLGLVSTLVLARILTPADFGLVAMAVSIAAALELITLFGFDVALLQRRELVREDYDTAWTLNGLLGLGIGAGMWLAAAPAAAFYRTPDLELVIRIFALKHVVRSLTNTGIIDFRRAMNFRWDFVMQVLPKLGGILLTIPLALWLRSYWALIAGTVFTEVVAAATSYVIHPHRPRPCLAGAGALFRFSRWILLNNLINFFRQRAATFVVGRIAGSASLGVYGLAFEIANLPTTEMVAPINRVLFPSYVKVAHDPVRLREAFSSTLGLIAVIILPVSIGIAAVADPLVRVMLGDQWLEAIPLIALLAVAGAGNVLQTNTGSVQTALGQPHQITVTGSLQMLVLLPAIVAGTISGGVLGTAIAITAYSWLFGLASTYTILLRTTPVTLGDAWRPVWRPLVAAVTMYGVVTLALAPLDPARSFGAAALALVTGTVAGAGWYGVTLYGLWLAAGRPESTEASLLRRLGPAGRWLATAGRTA